MTDSNIAKSLINKKIDDLTYDELDELKRAASNELRKRTLEDLETVAAQYVHLYGKSEGIDKMGEDLCKLIAPRKHPDGWDGLVRHLVKISG